MFSSPRKDKPIPIAEKQASSSDISAERTVWIVLIIGVILAIIIHL